jgi:ATP-dependent protease ClpP protease subunit
MTGMEIIDMGNIGNIGNIGSDNAIYAQYHSLFWEEHQSKMEPLFTADENGNELQVPGVYEEQPGFTLYKLFIGDFAETGNGLQKIINKLQQAGPDDILELHISSHGGVVDELVEIHNLCDTLFYDRVVTYLNIGYSAGAWAFLLGKERLVYEHSDLMFHSYAGGGYGKRDDMLNHIEHQDKRVSKYLGDTLKPYFTKKEIRKMMKGQDYWLDTEEMCRRGIATHVMVKGDVYTAEDYLKSLKKKNKGKK